MKITVYNQGGINHTRIQDRVERRLQEGVLRRVRYSTSDKVKILAAVDRMMVEDRLSQSQAAALLQISPSQVTRWRAKSSSFQQEADNKPNSLQLHRGPAAFLEEVNELMLSYMTEWHAKGMDVSCLSLIRKACQLSPGFAGKSLDAQRACISRFMMRNGLTHRMATHVAQRSPEQVYEEAKGHLEVMVPLVNDINRSPAFTLNMDQTPMWYAMTPKTTIEPRGSRTVNVRTATGDSERVTVAVTITASGHLLPSMVVFKGSPTGTIARREIPTLPRGLLYRVNAKAWFNEQIMLDWVEHVLAPYVATAPEGIVPILFLDMFKVHMMQSVVQAIQALGVQVEFIPAGCTGLVQPVDVGFNKSLKAKMREQFHDWIFAQDADQEIRAATRHELSEWIIAAQKNISEVTIRNAWKKTNFSYYPDHPRE